MRTVRIVAASCLVLVGALLVAAGSLSGAAVRVVNDGTAAGTITQRLLASPEVAQVAADRIQAKLREQASGAGPAELIRLFDQQIHQAIVGILSSNLVGSVVTNSVRQVSDQLVAALTEPNRPPGPFVVSADLSDRVNASLHAVPVVGPLIPPVTVPPVQVDVIDAAAFAQVRDAYRAAVLAERWFFWLGLILIVAGWRAAPKGRWYWTYAAAGTALVSLGVAFTVNALSPRSLASALPGGGSGGAGTFVSTFVSEGEIARLSSGLTVTWVVAVALAGLFAVATRRMPPGWSEGVRARVRAALASPKTPMSAMAAGDTVVATQAEDGDPGVVERPRADAAPADEADAGIANTGTANEATSGADADADDADIVPREASVRHFLPEPTEVVEVEEWPAPRPATPASPEPWAQVSSREPVAMRATGSDRDRAFDLDGSAASVPGNAPDAVWEGLAAFADVAEISSGQGEDSAPLTAKAAADKPAAKNPAGTVSQGTKPAAKKRPATKAATERTPPAKSAPKTLAARKPPAKKPAATRPPASGRGQPSKPPKHPEG